MRPAPGRSWSPAAYRASSRADAPFVTVNCAALPEALLESELFGHRRGAFTGAPDDQQGRFRAAKGGVIFLDEIGEMPLAMQAKLLRVVQENGVTPLGHTRPSKIDVRVISATNRDLKGVGGACLSSGSLLPPGATPHALCGPWLEMRQRIGWLTNQPLAIYILREIDDHLRRSCDRGS